MFEIFLDRLEKFQISCCRRRSSGRQSSIGENPVKLRQFLFQEIEILITSKASPSDTLRFLTFALYLATTQCVFSSSFSNGLSRASSEDRREMEDEVFTTIEIQSLHFDDECRMFVVRSGTIA